MPTEHQRAELAQARAVLAAALEQRRRRVVDHVAARRELIALSRRFGRDDQRVQAVAARLSRAEVALSEARAGTQRAREAVAVRAAAWLGDGGDGIETEWAQLGADHPIALLPVRIETRFARDAAGADELRVRVYPDALSVDGHDEALTEAERDAGVSYWTDVGQGTPETEAWTTLVAAYGSARAAWLVTALEPTNLDAMPDAPPVFPDVELRAASWDRAPRAALLPDRWIVVCYRDGQVQHRVATGPVQEPLAFGFDPHASPDAVVTLSEGRLELDEELVWTVDFDRALDAGMAARIPIDATDRTQGFDRVFVLGVRGSLEPEAAATELEALLASHHYNSGWALVAQGSPTNNTEGAAAAVPPPDPDAVRSFAIERGAALDREGADGRRLTDALGIDGQTVRHVAGADGAEQQRAEAMAQAIWPAAGGYFLDQMMAPHIDADDVEAVRRHAVRYVRGRGPLPALRVGRQPYGVLPVTSLQRWMPRRGAPQLERELVEILRRLWPVWTNAADGVPRVGRTGDPDADLLEILGLHPSSRSVDVRVALGPDWQVNLLAFMDLQLDAWQAAQQGRATWVMDRVGVPDWQPRILDVVFGADAGRYRHPLVARVVSETRSLDADYVAWVRGATLDELRNEIWPENASVPNALLYRVLRHARLQQIARLAIDLHVEHGMALASERTEPELVGVADGTRDRPTRWQRLAEPIAAVSGAVPIGEHLLGDEAGQEAAPLRSLDAALADLEGVPTAELERLFTETLDAGSHRLDAWVTSVAAARLDAMRENQPRGLHVGGYGWVENLRPRSSDPGAGGYVHTPSLDHAAAAAVLRSGYVTRGASGAYAIDLSSARVRGALETLDAVREGQPVGAVLGASFERALRQSNRSLGRFVEPLRNRFPLVAGKSGAGTTPAERAAARMVVDGLALRAAHRSGQLDLAHADFSTGDPDRDAADRAAVVEALQGLSGAVDSVGDLLLAESVFQAVSGRPGSAGASLDAIARGTPPADPAIVRQPQPGIPVSHRVAVVLGEDDALPPGWPTSPTPRAAAEPSLDAWLGQRLGDPRRIRCTASVTRPGEIDGTARAVTLAELGLRPIDLLFVGIPATGAPVVPQSELDRRVAAAALLGAPPGSTVRIGYGVNPTWDADVIAFTQAFFVVGETAQLLSLVRPLEVGDVVMPSEADALEPPPPLPDTEQRAAAALTALGQARATLEAGLGNPAARAAALRQAARLLPSVFPDPQVAVSEERAVGVRDELARRAASAAAATDPSAVVAAVFGEQFPFLPRFGLPNADELDRAVAASGSIGATEVAADRWLAQSARVRERLQRLRTIGSAATALGAAAPSPTAVQLPVREGARWVALPFAAPDRPHVAGTLSLIALATGSPSPISSWAGLLIDEWADVIPDPDPTTGVTFHFDTPGTEAPHAVLLAVPPRDEAHWSLDDVLAIVNETLDLAHIRAVDTPLLGSLARLLPATYLAANAANDTVSTPFVGDLVATTAVAVSPEDV